MNIFGFCQHHIARMLFGFLVLLLAVLGEGWSAPTDEHNVVKDLSETEFGVSNFFAALNKRNFSQLPSLFDKLSASDPKLKADFDTVLKLQRLALDLSNQVFKRLLSIQLQTALTKLQQLLTDNDEGDVNKGEVVIVQNVTVTNETTVHSEPSTEATSTTSPTNLTVEIDQSEPDTGDNGDPRKDRLLTSIKHGKKRPRRSRNRLHSLRTKENKH